jgi:YHS domain-containing protein
MTAILALLAVSAPELVLRGLDPVELRAGRETEGRETLIADHENYRYRFVSEANRSRFLAHPGLFAVQIGGACGSMGPLSGRGRTDLFAVVGGRTYLFASEACRRAVLANPGAYVDGADPRPTWGADVVADGLSAIREIVKAHGGQSALDGLGGLVWQVRSSYQEQGRTKFFTLTDGFFAGRTWFHEEAYEGSRYLSLSGPQGDWSVTKERTPLARSEAEFLRRRISHHPVVVMSQWRQPGFLARRVDGSTVDVWFDGSATRMETGPDGTVVSATFRDRGNRGYTRFHRTFSDFRPVRGFLVPHRQQSVVGGTAMPSVSAHRVWAGVDAPLGFLRR